MIAPDGERRRIRKGVEALQPGDRVEIRSGGGGGLGDPAERDRPSVAADVRRGLVSEAAARFLYGFDGAWDPPSNSQPGEKPPPNLVEPVPAA